MTSALRILWRTYRAMLGLYVLILGGAFAIAETATSTMEDRAWLTSMLTGVSVPKYFTSVVGLVLTTTSLPLLVANGLTRRRVMAAAAVLGGVVALAFTAVNLGLLTVHLKLADEPVSGLMVARAALVFIPLYLAYFGAGCLIGLGYYRFGPWIGTLMLPVTAAPAWLAEIAISAAWLTPPFAGIHEGFLVIPSFGVGVGLAAACCVVAAVGVYLIGRDVPIKPRQS